MPTIVSITNTYPDRRSVTVVTVDSPDPTRNLTGWWEDKVFPHTGDGHGQRQYAIHTAIIMSSDVIGMVGRTFEWDG